MPGFFRLCSNHGFKISPNLLDRIFNPASPSKSWVSDITYIRTDERWLYLTMIMDLYDCKIIEWSMSTTMEAGKTIIPAWRMAKINRPFFMDLIFHSDRGIQKREPFAQMFETGKIIKFPCHFGNEDSPFNESRDRNALGAYINTPSGSAKGVQKV